MFHLCSHVNRICAVFSRPPDSAPCGAGANGERPAGFADDDGPANKKPGRLHPGSQVSRVWQRLSCRRPSDPCRPRTSARCVPECRSSACRSERLRPFEASRRDTEKLPKPIETNVAAALQFGPVIVSNTASTAPKLRHPSSTEAGLSRRLQTRVRSCSCSVHFLALCRLISVRNGDPTHFEVGGRPYASETLAL